MVNHWHKFKGGGPCSSTAAMDHSHPNQYCLRCVYCRHIGLVPAPALPCLHNYRSGACPCTHRLEQQCVQYSYKAGCHYIVMKCLPSQAACLAYIAPHRLLTSSAAASHTRLPRTPSLAPDCWCHWPTIIAVAHRSAHTPYWGICTADWEAAVD